MSNLELLRLKLEQANERHSKGDIAAALPAYRAILNDWPNQPDALHMLGIIAMQMGNMVLAARLFDETVKAVPQFGLGWANRAVAYRAMGHNDEAKVSVRRALDNDPTFAGAWNMSGILLRDERRYDEALQHHARAAELDPGNANIMQNYAAILRTCGRIEKAWQAARKAEISAPQRADTLSTIGDILVAAGYPDRAIAYYHKAQAADARYVDAFTAEATAHLLMGDFARGWELMEKRKLYLHDKRCQSLPRWNGESVDHLLLVAEQGAGDNIQSARYIPLLKGRAERITLQVPKSLQRLMQFNFPDIAVITPDDPLPEADAYEPVMSLAYHCAAPPQEFLAPPFYLKSDPAWAAPWRERLKAVPCPRIAFVWAGNPQHINDYNRSITLDQIMPLVSLAEGHALAMQKDGRTYDLSVFTFDAAPDLGDYADAAGLMNELDLLITVDTSPAHLMGALGRPVWCLLPFSPDWRHLIGRDDSIWYSSMRFFRQRTPGDWATTVNEAAGELRKYVAGDRSVLEPARWDAPPLRQNPLALKLPD